MKASELVTQLQALIAEHGDLHIVADNYDYGSGPQFLSSAKVGYAEICEYDVKSAYVRLYEQAELQLLPVLVVSPAANRLEARLSD